MEFIIIFPTADEQAYLAQAQTAYCAFEKKSHRLQSCLSLSKEYSHPIFAHYSGL